MSEKETLVTEEGLQKLKEELEHLITVKRPEVVEKIKIAAVTVILVKTQSMMPLAMSRPLLSPAFYSCKR